MIYTIAVGETAIFILTLFYTDRVKIFDELKNIKQIEKNYDEKKLSLAFHKDKINEAIKKYVIPLIIKELK